MKKIVVTTQVLDMSFNHGRPTIFEINNADELYKFRRHRFPDYARVLATVYIEEFGHTVQIVSSTHRIGQSVFNTVRDIVFMYAVNRMFD